jgi:hypothetical protein
MTHYAGLGQNGPLHRFEGLGTREWGLGGVVSQLCLVLAGQHPRTTPPFQVKLSQEILEGGARFPGIFPLSLIFFWPPLGSSPALPAGQDRSSAIPPK